MKQCCGTCERVRRAGENGLTEQAGICGAHEDSGHGELVVILDDPKMGSKCESYRPALDNSRKTCAR